MSLLLNCLNKTNFNYVALATSKLLPVIVPKMDGSILKEVPKLLERLAEAERRAKLLKCEIEDIRRQIANLTQSSYNILDGLGGSSVSLRNFQKQDGIDSVPSISSKRPAEEPVSFHNEKKARGNMPMENGYVVVYTDGACENNGKANAKAGIGVWFSEDNALNISKPVTGRATNNTAEIQAPTEALRVLQNLGHTRVKIITDSQFTINCMTKWIGKWKKNQWKLAGGGPVKNKLDLVKLDNLCQQFQDVKWEYCAGHRGIKGNEEADKLAREGALRYTSSNR